MNEPTTNASAKPRKGARKPSVIEAVANVPMPVVEPAEPVAEAAPEPVAAPEAAPTPEVARVADAQPVSAEPSIPAPLVPAPVAPTPLSAAAPVPAVPPAAVPADIVKDAKMDTVDTLNTTAKTQAMFADMNDRAKGAMERGAKLVEDMAQFNKGNLEALVESSKIAARGFESLGQDVAAFAKQAFEQQAAAMRQLATVKSPTEFMKLQGDLVRQSFDQTVQQSSRQAETVLKLAGEVAQPVANRFAVAMEKAKVTA